MVLIQLTCVFGVFVGFPVIVFGQSIAVSPVSGYLCAVNCTFRHANAWATVLSLNNPSAQLIKWVQGISVTTVSPLVPIANDSLSRVCEVYDSYRGCLDACAPDFFRDNVISTLAGIETICTTARKEVTSNTMPCVQQFSNEIQKICRRENEELLSATNQLQSTDKATPAINFITLLQRLCQSALNQSFCVVPLLQQKCGNSASDLLSQLLTASLGSVEKLIGDKHNLMPVSCKELFNTIIKHDNGTVSFRIPEVLTSTFVWTTTPAANVHQEQSTLFRLDNGTANHLSQKQNDTATGGAYSTMIVGSHVAVFTIVILFILQNS